MKCLLVIVSLFTLGCCQSNLSAYPLSAVLRADGSGNPLYTLHWNFSATEETITFGVNVSTNGWVGFGISPNGGMTNSDVVIGWVNDNGEVFFDDRFAFDQSRPPVDPQQDWTLIRGESANGYTVLEFWRKWVACDERDRDILADTSRVVYAWNDNDPENDDADNGPMYHGANRGAAPLNLLSGVTSPVKMEAGQGSFQTFTLGVENITIPSDDTTYWCAALELPQEIQQQKQYIVKYSPVITPNEFQYVHHMLIYLCDSFNETEAGNSAPCFGMTGTSVSECRRGSLIAGWAVGGTDFIYPDNVAYPLGGAGNPRFVVVEMHYDNPNLQSGVMDSSGIQFFYTSEPPQFEAGILNLGHLIFNNLLVIPPRTERFDIIGACAPECTSQYLPPEGIKIIGNLLHTHLAGRGITLRLIRNTDECGGLEEMRPIDQNLQYDFNFQQFTVLPNEITVLPGDILLVECNYNTSERTGVTLGGESTREEMCLSFPVYYPRVPLSACVSTPGQTAFNQFGAQFISQEDQSPLMEAWFSDDTAAAEAALDRYIDWTPAAAAALQESILNGDLFTVCTTTDSDTVINRQERLPQVKCPYKAPDQCTAGAGALIGNAVITAGLLTLTVLLL